MNQQPASSPAKVSLLPQYAGISAVRKKNRKAPEDIPVAIDDPWPDQAPAFLKAPPKQTETVNPEEVEWIVPGKPLIEVRASRRDVIAGMYARGQMGKPEFDAARDYAQTFAVAMALPVKGVDPSNPAVQGGGGGVGPIDAVVAASERLQRIERRLTRAYGNKAVTLARDVIGRGVTVRNAAKLYARDGTATEESVRWWGGTLREVLQELAEITGHAVRGAYRNRAREEERRDRIEQAQQRRDRERRHRGKSRQRKVKPDA